MASVQEHYDNHLGAIYGWMIGDFETAKAAAREGPRAAGIFDGAGCMAVDLGAGPGAHASALAEAGYSVIAIDACAELLKELRANSRDSAVCCVHADVTDLRRHWDRPAHVVLCMGDTLTHLPSLASVDALFADVAEVLAPGGLFIATFRDYASKTLEGDARFIPVRLAKSRILTCFLEYGNTTVTVHDLLHEWTESGWSLRVSSYPKLRLSPEWARSTLERHGLTASLTPGPRGMTRLIGRQPFARSADL
jgi:2-polyprenyl-3-methyl-5-hydroxy-6-metoxy-1,4-benzoquinol methylase